MLNVAFLELPACTQQQLLAHQPGLGMDQGHHVLQLVAETEGPARLIEATTPPQPAGHDLVHQPAIDQHVDRGVGGFHLHRAERPPPVDLHRLERITCCRCAALTQRELAGLVGIAPHTEAEHHLALLALGQFDADLDRRTRVDTGTNLAGQALPPHRRGIGKGPVATDELDAAAGHAARPVVNIEEGDAPGELGVVEVSGLEHATARVDIGAHVHRRLGPQIPKHPLDIAGCRKPPRPTGFVADPECRELHCRVRRHIDPQ